MTTYFTPRAGGAQPSTRLRIVAVAAQTYADVAGNWPNHIYPVAFQLSRPLTFNELELVQSDDHWSMSIDDNTLVYSDTNLELVRDNLMKYQNYLVVLEQRGRDRAKAQTSALAGRHQLAAEVNEMLQRPPG